MALAKQTFTDNGTFVVPAGVTRVKIIATPQGANGVALNFGQNFNAYFMDNTQNIWGMGGNAGGSLGNNNLTTPQSSPVMVVGGNKWLKIIPTIACGLGNNNSQNLFAIDTQGLTWAWGFNAQGELGGGVLGTPYSSPILVNAPNGSLFKQLLHFSPRGFSVNTYDAVVALDYTGAAWSWGVQIGNNILGIGSDWHLTNNVGSPTAVLGGHTFSKLFGGCPDISNSNGYASCWGLTTSGQLWGWGANPTGMLGNNSNPLTLNLVSSPVQVLGATSYAQVFPPNCVTNEANEATTFFLDTSGNLWAAGSNVYGQLGANVSTLTAAVSSPAMVVGGYKFVAMSEVIYRSVNGPSTYVGLDANGNAYAWGNNTDGACGNGVSPAVTTGYSSPVAVVGGYKFSKVYNYAQTYTAGGHQAFFGITTDGKLYAWGDNSTGLLGTGDFLSRSSPTLISFPGGFTTIKKLVFTNGSILALSDSGALCSWGYNLKGSTGLNITGATPIAPYLVQTSTPSLVSGSYYEVWADQNEAGSVYAASLNGNLYAWGYDGNGQLGLASTFNNSTSAPLLVVGNRGINTSTPQTITELSVTPGASIPVILRGANALFGTTQVGYICDQMIVQFEQ